MRTLPQWAYVLPLVAAPFLMAQSAPAGCNGNLNPQATADIQSALAVGCPILNSVQGDVAAGVLKVNKFQAAAIQTLATVCPPNPPPTNVAAVTSDVLSAVALLQPLVR